MIERRVNSLRWSRTLSRIQNNNSLIDNNIVQRFTIQTYIFIMINKQVINFFLEKKNIYSYIYFPYNTLSDTHPSDNLKQSWPAQQDEL
ncbi:uncharacterized protein BX663DRAFT_524791, partial [Cokeromyces recurvatus]|uniref:uncharacterized protein n=1 Tax=Cokeromyces recurvatus TaxID=90255 RepID=UPI00221E4841